MIEINLLPHREAKRAADLRESVALLLLGLLVIAAGVIFMNGKVNDQLAGARAQVQQLESDITRYKPQEQQVAKFRKKKSELEDKLEVIRGLDRARTGPVRMFDELARKTPERLWLTKLSTEAGKIRLEGNSLDNGVVADFLKAMNGSEYFANVDLLKTGGGTQIKGVRLVRFEISADMVTPTDDDEKKSDAGKAAEA
jgi:type IV pilus assembly protein PilN